MAVQTILTDTPLKLGKENGIIQDLRHACLNFMKRGEKTLQYYSRTQLAKRYEKCISFRVNLIQGRWTLNQDVHEGTTGTVFSFFLTV